LFLSFDNLLETVYFVSVESLKISFACQVIIAFELKLVFVEGSQLLDALIVLDIDFYFSSDFSFLPFSPVSLLRSFFIFPCQFFSIYLQVRSIFVLSFFKLITQSSSI